VTDRLAHGYFDNPACADYQPNCTQSWNQVTRIGKTMAAQRGLTFTTAKTGEYVSGKLVGSAQLASGRFAMINDGIGFQLVPWQPVLDKRVGQHITGVVRNAGGIEWSFGRKRGLGYEGDLRPHLLVAMGAAPAPSGKGSRCLRSPAPPACGLDRLAPARQGLAKQVRQEVSRRMQAFLRRKSMTRISDFSHGILGCFHPMDPDEGASVWQRKRNRRAPVRPTTTDRTAASLSIPAFCGLQKPSADSLLARRVSLRSPPMTINPADDSNVGNVLPKTGLGFSEPVTFSSCMAHSHR
jgi:hypothetical protein